MATHQPTEEGGTQEKTVVAPPTRFTKSCDDNNHTNNDNNDKSNNTSNRGAIHLQRGLPVPPPLPLQLPVRSNAKPTAASLAVDLPRVLEARSHDLRGGNISSSFPSRLPSTNTTSTTVNFHPLTSRPASKPGLSNNMASTNTANAPAHRGSSRSSMGEHESRRETVVAQLPVLEVDCISEPLCRSPSSSASRVRAAAVTQSDQATPSPTRNTPSVNHRALAVMKAVSRSLAVTRGASANRGRRRHDGTASAGDQSSSNECSCPSNSNDRVRAASLVPGHPAPLLLPGRRQTTPAEVLTFAHIAARAAAGAQVDASAASPTVLRDLCGKAEGGQSTQAEQGGASPKPALAPPLPAASSSTGDAEDPTMRFLRLLHSPDPRPVRLAPLEGTLAPRPPSPPTSTARPPRAYETVQTTDSHAAADDTIRDHHDSTTTAACRSVTRDCDSTVFFQLTSTSAAKDTDLSGSALTPPANSARHTNPRIRRLLELQRGRSADGESGHAGGASGKRKEAVGEGAEDHRPSSSPPRHSGKVDACAETTAGGDGSQTAATIQRPVDNASTDNSSSEHAAQMEEAAPSRATAASTVDRKCGGGGGVGVAASPPTVPPTQTFHTSLVDMQDDPDAPAGLHQRLQQLHRQQKQKQKQQSGEGPETNTGERRREADTKTRIQCAEEPMSTPAASVVPENEANCAVANAAVAGPATPIRQERKGEALLMAPSPPCNAAAANMPFSPSSTSNTDSKRMSVTQGFIPISDDNNESNARNYIALLSASTSLPLVFSSIASSLADAPLDMLLTTTIGTPAAAAALAAFNVSLASSAHTTASHKGTRMEKQPSASAANSDHRYPHRSPRQDAHSCSDGTSAQSGLPESSRTRRTYRDGSETGLQQTRYSDPDSMRTTISSQSGNYGASNALGLHRLLCVPPTTSTGSGDGDATAAFRTCGGGGGGTAAAGSTNGSLTSPSKDCHSDSYHAIYSPTYATLTPSTAQSSTVVRPMPRICSVDGSDGGQCAHRWKGVTLHQQQHGGRAKQHQCPLESAHEAMKGEDGELIVSATSSTVSFDLAAGDDEEHNTSTNAANHGGRQLHNNNNNNRRPNVVSSSGSTMESVARRRVTNFVWSPEASGAADHAAAAAATVWGSSASAFRPGAGNGGCGSFGVGRGSWSTSLPSSSILVRGRDPRSASRSPHQRREDATAAPLAPDSRIPSLAACSTTVVPNLCASAVDAMPVAEGGATFPPSQRQCEPTAATRSQSTAAAPTTAVVTAAAANHRLVMELLLSDPDAPPFLAVHRQLDTTPTRPATSGSHGDSTNPSLTPTSSSLALPLTARTASGPASSLPASEEALVVGLHAVSVHSSYANSANSASSFLPSFGHSLPQSLGCQSSHTHGGGATFPSPAGLPTPPQQPKPQQLLQAARDTQQSVVRAEMVAVLVRPINSVADGNGSNACGDSGKNDNRSVAASTMTTTIAVASVTSFPVSEGTVLEMHADNAAASAAGPRAYASPLEDSSSVDSDHGARNGKSASPLGSFRGASLYGSSLHAPYLDALPTAGASGSTRQVAKAEAKVPHSDPNTLLVPSSSTEHAEAERNPTVAHRRAAPASTTNDASSVATTAATATVEELFVYEAPATPVPLIPSPPALPLPSLLRLTRSQHASSQVLTGTARERTHTGRHPAQLHTATLPVGTPEATEPPPPPSQEERHGDEAQRPSFSSTEIHLPRYTTARRRSQ